MSEMNLRQKVAYLQGLAEGLQLDPQNKEGRILGEVIGLLSEMSEALYDLKGAHDELESYMEEMDQDLSVVEEDLYGEEGDDGDEDENEEPDLEAVEVKCPNCGTVLHLERRDGDADDTLDLICPNCGEMIYDNDDDLVYSEDGDGESSEGPGRAAGRPHDQHQHTPESDLS
ncbi:MAG: zinc ribbon domain-containing protein [Firmicutes bacterium]|nr:zinc ribbon domain-containing protein [Bacillota bacterium]